MNIREALNQQGPAFKVVVTVLCGVAAVFFYFSMRSDRSRNAFLAYYSTDDGKTAFTDDFFLAYPFSHDGKTAVRAYMYQTSSGKQFVGFLERYTEDGLKQIRNILASSQNRDQLRGAIERIRQQYTQVKAPNDPNGTWYSAGSPSANEVEGARSPDHPSETCILVFP